MLPTLRLRFAALFLRDEMETILYAVMFWHAGTSKSEIWTLFDAVLHDDMRMNVSVDMGERYRSMIDPVVICATES